MVAVVLISGISVAVDDPLLVEFPVCRSVLIIIMSYDYYTCTVTKLKKEIAIN